MREPTRTACRSSWCSSGRRPSGPRRYVLTPFVVECRAGQGLPRGRDRRRAIVEAVEHARRPRRARVPVLHEKVGRGRRGYVDGAHGRSLATLGKRSRPARPLITLEQIRMLAELRRLEQPTPASAQDALKDAAPFAAAALGAGFVFREAATVARRVLPADSSRMPVSRRPGRGRSARPSAGTRTALA